METDFEVKRATLPDGLSMAYIEAGIDDRRFGPIIWVHGMGSYREVFHSCLAQPILPGRQIAVDLPGFGSSGHWRIRHRLDDYPRALSEFMDALNIPSAIFIGHSFGGMVAGEMATRYPGKVQGAILVSSAGWFDPENALTPTPFVWVNRVGIWITGLEVFGRQMVRALGVDPSQLSALDRKRFQWGWRHAYEMARMGAFYHAPHFTERVIQAGVPVAVIHGDRDILFPLDKVQNAIRGRLALWVIEGSGHVPFYSRPEAFSGALGAAYRYIREFPHSGSQ